MMFGNQGTQVSSRRVTDPASWETPDRASGVASIRRAELLKGSLTIAGVVGFFRQNGRRIVLLAAALFALGVLILAIIPVRYAATALVVVDPREQRVTNEQDVLPGIGQDAAALQSWIEIAKSDGFLRPLIERLGIKDDSDIAGSETDPSKLLEKFRSRLDISRRGLTYVIAMTVISNSPQKAASYANAVAEAFVANQTGVRTAATDEAAGWLNSRLKTLSDRLRISEDAVAKFRRDYKIVSAGRDGTTQQLRVTELNQQASAARLRAEEARTRYQQAQRDLKANVDGPVKQDLLSMLRAQRSALNDQIAQKRAVLGDRHPDLVMSHSQLSDLNRQIEAERKRNIESAKSEYESLLEQQKSLETQLKSFEGEMLVDGQALVKLQELQRDAEANKNIYEQFLSRFKTTNEQRLLQNTQAKIVSVATPPIRSTRPSLALLLAAIAIASILTATAAVALLEANKQLPEPGLPAPSPAVNPEPVLVPVPVVPVPQRRDIPVWTRIPYLAPADIRKTIWQKPLVPIAELDVGAYLPALLERAVCAPDARGKVTVVTSIKSGVGVSTVARSLNLAALSSGKISALIQAQPDALVPHETRIDAEAGTADGSRASRASLHSIGLLLAGGASSPPADDFRSEFDLIVIDAPPLTAAPEVAALLSQADVVVVVVGHDEADPATILNALLSNAGSAAVGMVINQASLPRVQARTQGKISELAS